MNICKMCGNEIPRYIHIDGYKKNIGNRKHCLECVPFKDFRNSILLQDNKRNNEQKSKLAKYSKDELQKIFDSSNNYIEVLKTVGLTGNSNNYNTLNRYIKELNIDLEQININRKQKQKELSDIRTRQNKDIYTLLKSGDLNWKPSKLLDTIIDNNIKEYRCEKCGIKDYNGQPIRLELHHKDGNRNNNCLGNLEILCPNCHSQTDNFRFKNRKH